MLRLRLGRVLVESAQKIDEALDVYRAVYEADGENAEAIGALEQLYRQTSRFGELLGIYEKKRDLSTTADEKKAINAEIAQPLRERDQGRRSRDRHLRPGPRRRAERRPGARRARRALRPPRALGALRRRPAPTHRARRRRDESSSISSSGSARRSRSTSATPPARSRTTARSCSSTPRTRALARRSRRCSRATCARRPPRSSSRSTRSAATGRS